ncbi:hypothetical protein GCM10027294_51930 [Marinactinospora endophytica]
MDPHMNWRKSSYSAPSNNNCVEVADLPAATAVRDSQNPDLGHLTFPSSEMAAFVTAVRSGEL